MEREKIFYVVFGALLLLLAGSYIYQGGSLWGPCRMGGGYGGMGSGMHQGGVGLFGLGFHGFGLLFWILVIFFLVLVFSNGKKKTERAIDVLNKRYAKGEISKEEYLQMKEEIGKE